MSLPTELRLLILEYLLVASDGLVRVYPYPRWRYSHIEFTSSGNVSPGHARIGFKIGLWPSILATCRQMYEEAWPLLYHRNTLKFKTVTDARISFGPKFQRRASEIRHIAIRSDYCNPLEDIGLVHCATIISSFTNLRTVRILYHYRMLNDLHRYEYLRERERQESSSEQRESPRRDGVVSNPGLEQLKMTWIGEEFSTRTTTLLAPRLEEALRAEIAEIAEMSSCEKDPWKVYC